MFRMAGTLYFSSGEERKGLGDVNAIQWRLPVWRLAKMLSFEVAIPGFRVTIKEEE